jgi:hypothetical protein
MSVSPSLVDHAASLVRRTRAGDQNAQAMIYRIGEESRKGNNTRAAAIALAIKQFIEKNPPKDFVLGAEPALLANTPQESTALAARAAPAKLTAAQIEARKPPIPRGLLDKLFDPELFALVIVRACSYRNGLPAAAVVLASGPPLTAAAVQQLGISQFGSDESSAVFFHGVKFCGEAAWAEVAPHLDPFMKRCLAVGQCVGRARRIQMVRLPRSAISNYSPVAGWELGE